MRKEGNLSIGPYYITFSADAARYNLPTIGAGTITGHQRLSVPPFFIEFDPAQKSQTRTYIPWLSENKVIYGGGENPLARGGIAAPYLFQWAFQQAFQRITGDRFEPRKEDYDTTSKRLYQVYLNRETCMKRKADPLELLGIMYLWARTGKIDSTQAGQWISAVREAMSETVAESEFARLAFLGMFPDALGDIAANVFLPLADMLDLSSLDCALRRYILTIEVLQKMTFFWSTKNWYNHAMVLHTTHYALDDEVVRANGDRQSAVDIACAVNAMVKTVLCGERLPKISLGEITIGSPDDDLYAAVIAKGLLQRYCSFESLKCSPLPPEIGPAAAMMQYPYLDRINAAVEGRSRMWEDSPLTELWWVRNRSAGWEQAPVRWHNSDAKETAKWGLDFCWERPESNRVMGWGKSKHDRAGLMVTEPWTCESDDDHSACKPSAPLNAKFAKGIDVAFEAGGLDFLFPRILMSYWWNEPVLFQDAHIPLLKGITCLPWRGDGRYKEARCRSYTSDWLLLSSAH